MYGLAELSAKTYNKFFKQLDLNHLFSYFIKLIILGKHIFW